MNSFLKLLGGYVLNNLVNHSSLNTGALEYLTLRQETVGEHKIAYEVLGGSPEPKRTIILLHGAFATRNATKILANKLADFRKSDRIILVDAPWHGASESELSIDGANINTYADVLADFVTAMKEKGLIQGKLAWFGWSMGGSIGMLLDLKGVKIDELILINSSPVWETLGHVVQQVPALADPLTARDVFKSVMMEDFKDGVTDAERNQIFDNYDAIIDEATVMVNDLSALATEHYDIRERLSEIKAKTMIYSTEDDMLALSEMQDVMANAIPNSVKHVQKTGGHSGLMKPSDAEIIASCFVEVFDPATN